MDRFMFPVPSGIWYSHVIEIPCSFWNGKMVAISITTILNTYVCIKYTYISYILQCTVCLSNFVADQSFFLTCLIFEAFDTFLSANKLRISAMLEREEYRKQYIISDDLSLKHWDKLYVLMPIANLDEYDMKLIWPHCEHPRTLKWLGWGTGRRSGRRGRGGWAGMVWSAGGSTPRCPAIPLSRPQERPSLKTLM